MHLSSLCLGHIALGDHTHTQNTPRIGLHFLTNSNKTKQKQHKKDNKTNKKQTNKQTKRITTSATQQQ